MKSKSTKPNRVKPNSIKTAPTAHAMSELRMRTAVMLLPAIITARNRGKSITEIDIKGDVRECFANVDALIKALGENQIPTDLDLNWPFWKNKGIKNI